MFYLYEIPFKSITVEFDTGTTLFVSKVKSKGKTDGDLSTDEMLVTKFSYKRGRKLIMKFEIDQEKFLASEYYEKNHKNQAERDRDSYRSIKWLSYKFRDDDAIEKLIMNLSLLNTTFIRSQRLYNENKDGKSQRAINEVNQKLSDILNSNKYLEYIS